MKLLSRILSSIATIALLIGSAPAQTLAPKPESAPNPAPAQTPPAEVKAAGADAAPVRHARLKYTPPKNAAAGTRVDGDGGSRGGGAKQPLLYVLSPDHTGLTTHSHPTLFWYQSGPATTRFELTVVEPKKAKPVLKVATAEAKEPGIHRLLLGKYNITLTPGILYRWTVALVPDPADRSQDVIANGTIQCIEPDAPLTAALANANGLDKAALYAEKGFWYDALEAVTDEINAAPTDKEIRLQRAALLDQAGLKIAAASERK